MQPKIVCNILIQTYRIYSNKRPLSIKGPSPINAHPKIEKLL